MEKHRAFLNVVAASLVGGGLTLGLLFLLSSHLSPVRAAAERATGFAPAPDGVITVCQGGACDFDVIQDAVDAAAEGDEIRVAAGTYTGVTHRRGLAQVVYVGKTITICGGYTVDDWTTSDPVANPTILDAQGEGRVLYLTGNIEPTIAGLHITGGDADGLGGPWTPPASDAGGGVFLDGVGGTLRDNWVFSNSADAGGGIHVGTGSRVALTNNTIAENVAASLGGGISMLYASAQVRGNRVEGNRASFGGGLYIEGTRASGLVTGNQITANEADWGGGLYLRRDGGRVVSNALSENTALGAGGGMVVQAASLVQLQANRVSRNVAQAGGGIALYSTRTSFYNTVVVDNEAMGSGSAIYVQGEASHPRFFHTTVAQRGSAVQSGQGTGVAVGSGAASFTNTVVVAQPIGVHAAEGTTVSLQGTLWGAGVWANGTDWDGPGTILTGAPEDNVWGDPAFVAPQTGDYHIGVSSAAVDRGIDAGVTGDIDDQPRPIPAGGQVDLGADESTGIDLSSSSKSASVGEAEPGEVITYLINLRNTGPLSAERVALRDPVPGSTSYVTGSARAASGVLTEGNSIRWSGTVSPHESITLTFAVTLNEDVVVRNTAVVTDAYGMGVSLQAWTNARHVYVPLLLRASP